jgi:hypothetical protein
MGVGLATGAATWRALGASVAGAGHRVRGRGCEDAHAVEIAADGVLLLAVADGAGSARLAERGSSLAVAVAMAALRDGARVDDALLCARAALEDEAAASGATLGDLATTLLVVRASADEVATAQVGDGAVVLRRSGGYEVPAPDAKGEYLNETVFLTSSAWRSSMRVACVDGQGVAAVAAMTDGLQLVAFDLASGAPHGPFFDPFVAFAAEDGPVEQLEAFLASARVAERTDDDVTLVVAIRAPAS